MEWTKKAPTQPGHYWHRWRNSAHNPLRYTLIELAPDTTGELTAWMPALESSPRWRDWQGEWCGPIEPPA